MVGSGRGCLGGKVRVGACKGGRGWAVRRGGVDWVER